MSADNHFAKLDQEIRNMLTRKEVQREIEEMQQAVLEEVAITFLRQHAKVQSALRVRGRLPSGRCRGGFFLTYSSTVLPLSLLTHVSKKNSGEKRTPSKEGATGVHYVDLGVNIVVSSKSAKHEDMGSIHVNTRKHTLLRTACLPLCQRLLGVRPGNRRNPGAELTLFMMRPAGREQIKRIDDKIRYSN